MEGNTTTLKPMGLAELMIPLTHVVRRELQQVNLLVGVSRDLEAHKVSEITAPLAERIGHDSKDVCCVFPHQLGSDRWRVITTHGTAQMTASAGSFQIGTHLDHLTPSETHIFQKLSGARNQLLSGLLGLPASGDVIPYAKVRGKVLLCGDFSLWDPGVLLALRHLFIANGAQTVSFITPVMTRDKCTSLQDHGCRVFRVHPPEMCA